MSIWDAMDELTAICDKYIDGTMKGRWPNGDPDALRSFQAEVAPKLSPLMLSVLVKAWIEKSPRPPRPVGQE